MNNNKLQPLVILPSYTGYEDRSLMFYKVAEKSIVGALHFHNKTNDIPSDFKYSIPKSNSSLTKWRTTLNVSRKWVKDKDNAIVHDLFTPRGVFGTIFNKKAKRVISLYADNANYYLGKRYKEETRGNSFKNRLYIHFMYIKRILIEYIGVMLADGIIANSPEIIEGIEKYYKPKNKKSAVINTCVDTSFWKEIKIEREKKTMFYAARLSKNKGIDVLLRAHKEMVKHDNTLKLVIAGTEAVEESFDWGYKYIKDENLANHVKFVGHLSRNEMRKWYNKSTVFVLPSPQEGSPRVVKEAIACGCPVVCADLPGTRTLDKSNQIIKLFESGNSSELENQLSNVIYKSNLNSTEIRNFAMDNFSPEIIADLNLKFYNNLYI